MVAFSSGNKQHNQRSLRMRPLTTSDATGFLITENFGSDASCDPSNSLTTTGLAEGECINWGHGQGSFMYFYSLSESAIEMSGNFYSDELCVNFVFREDSIKTNKLEECTPVISEGRLIKYVKYSYSSGGKIVAPYTLGYQELFFSSSNCDHVTSFSVKNGDLCVPSVGGYYSLTAYDFGCNDQLYTDESCTIGADGLSLNGLHTPAYTSMSSNVKCTSNGLLYHSYSCFQPSPGLDF